MKSFSDCCKKELKKYVDDSSLNSWLK